MTIVTLVIALVTKSHDPLSMSLCKIEGFLRIQSYAFGVRESFQI